VPAARLAPLIWTPDVAAAIASPALAGAVMLREAEAKLCFSSIAVVALR
jgi:hypothetical protein